MFKVLIFDNEKIIFNVDTISRVEFTKEVNKECGVYSKVYYSLFYNSSNTLIKKIRLSEYEEGYFTCKNCDLCNEDTDCNDVKKCYVRKDKYYFNTLLLNEAERQFVENALNIEEWLVNKNETELKIKVTDEFEFDFSEWRFN